MQLVQLVKRFVKHDCRIDPPGSGIKLIADPGGVRYAGWSLIPLAIIKLIADPGGVRYAGSTAVSLLCGGHSQCADSLLAGA